MDFSLLIVLSILPALILLWYFERQDKGLKEPRRLKWKIFWWGILATVFAGIIEVFMDDFIRKFVTEDTNFYLSIFLSAFVVAAFVEEALKMWVVKAHVYKSEHFNEIMDGITYTIIASLGFATFENIFYVLDGGFGIGILRALVSVPGHAFFSGIMGYYIGKARFEEDVSVSRKLLVKGFTIAVFYHGLFNFLLFTESMMIFLVFPLIIVMAYHLKHKIEKARFEDKVDGELEPHGYNGYIFGKIIRVFFGSLFLFVGAGSVVGSIMLVQDPSSGYGGADIAGSIIFALVLLFMSYRLLKRPRSSL